MQAALLTEWQCNFLYYKSNVALKEASMLQATLKSYVQPVKTISGNLLYTVITNNSDPTLCRKVWKQTLKVFKPLLKKKERKMLAFSTSNDGLGCSKQG